MSDGKGTERHNPDNCTNAKQATKDCLYHNSYRVDYDTHPARKKRETDRTNPVCRAGASPTFQKIGMPIAGIRRTGGDLPSVEPQTTFRFNFAPDAQHLNWPENGAPLGKYSTHRV